MKRTLITFLITCIALALMVIKASTAGQGNASTQQSQTSAQQQRKRLAELDMSIREIDRKIEELQTRRKTLELERANLYQAFLREAENQQQNVVYLTASGTTYHREGCMHLGGGDQQRRFSISLDKLSPFYVPCSYCKPSTKVAKDSRDASQPPQDPAVAYDQLVATSEANKTAQVYVHYNDRFYHIGSCPKKSALHTGMRLHIISAAYLPCDECNPPKYYPLIDNTTKRYFITQNGQYYHDFGCSALASGNSSTIEIGNVRGKYAPCPVCRPPLLSNRGGSDGTTFPKPDCTRLAHSSSLE